MRASEFVSEGKDRGNLRKGVKNAMPNLNSYDFLDNNAHPYLAYRFGVALAGSPDEDMDRQSATGSNFTMIDYTDADEKIRKGAEKVMGIKSSRGTGKGSEELPSANTLSPVPNRSKLSK